MNLIICADDQLGIFFNGRRQSQDRVLREYLLNLTAGHTLWMNAYSARQFGEAENIRVDENFLSRAEAGDYCFAEGISLSEAEASIEQLILCRWNRVYPADRFLDLAIKDGKWHLVSCKEFPGSSHEKITVEVYKK